MSNKESTNAFIGRNIELLLKENDMSQAELANRLGVSESAVGKWILGRNGPRMNMVQKMAEIFGVHFTEILQGKSGPSNPRRQYLMDKIAKADDKKLDRIRKLMELIDDEEDRNW